MSTILVIDDNSGICEAISVLFRLHDIGVCTAATPEEGLRALEHNEIQLVIQDMNFTSDTTSGAEGEALFRQIRSLYPDLPVILLTAWTHLESAVALVKEGAADYLGKPWEDDKLVATVRNLLALQAARASHEEMARAIREQRDALDDFDLCGIVFASPVMLRLLQTATQVARANVPVLVTGPNGAGKEKVAEIIHANSGRQGRFVTVNAGALPADLVESELFGTEAGAFTGAEKRPGWFEVADGGTLFLDEIGNLPPAGQAKLLRVLQTGEFERLGGREKISVDVRLITATNTDLPTAIREGAFREDLFYRINLIELALPSLNQRSEDIIPLAEHFLDGAATLSTAAVRALAAYHWPGNVRQLENCMKRVALLSAGREVTVEDLNLEPPTFSASRDPDATAVREALSAYNGVVASQPPASG